MIKALGFYICSGGLLATRHFGKPCAIMQKNLHTSTQRSMILRQPLKQQAGKTSIGSLSSGFTRQVIPNSTSAGIGHELTMTIIR